MANKVKYNTDAFKTLSILRYANPCFFSKKMSSIDETNTAATARPIAEEVTEVKTETPVISNPFAGLTAAAASSKENSKEEEGEGEDNEVRYKF